MTRASTRGGNGGGAGGILLWTLVAIVVGAVVVGSAFVLTQSNAGRNANVAEITTPSVLTPSDIPSSGVTLGKADAPMTIDVYGDFRCSYCYIFAVESGSKTKVAENYVRTGKAKMVWHDLLTIDSDGSNASRDAANAARCGADQGKFWLLHDWLFANQSPTELASAFTKDRLKAIGAKVPGLDTAKFNSCVDAGTHDAEIAAEVTPSTVTSTPTIIVNGKQASSWTYESIVQIIEYPDGSPSASASASSATTAAPTPTATPVPSAS